ncbi:MAG TPA: von Willebrand factor type A domain-containing protein, partial [Micromonospora sp.]
SACSDSSSGTHDSARGAAPPPAVGGAARPGAAEHPDTDSAPGTTPVDGREAGGEVDPRTDPRSTFAVDIDTASYDYSRRLIQDGRLPARDSVRPEEFVNSFEQGYPEPPGNGFTVQADGTRLPAGSTADGEGVRLMRIGLRTRADSQADRPDAALTFVVDVSGSMADPGRLDLVRDAMHTLVDRLRRTDSVAIVAFSNQARVIREMTRVTDAAALHDAIDQLQPQNSTNVEAGLVLGYRVARDGFRPGATNRVVLMSDGLANVGQTAADPILNRVREEAAKQISLLGVGVGSEYGDSLMERLADRGDGFVVYVSELERAREVFVKQLPATLTVRALDAKTQVTFDPGVVRSYRLIGYENRAVADEDFRDDRVDGGEVGPGHSVTALYLVRLVDGAAASARVAQVQVRWSDPASRKATEASGQVTVADLDQRFDSAPPRLQVCYAAAWFAGFLRGDAYGRQANLTELAGIADRAAQATEDQKVRELATTIRRAAELD